MGFVADIFAVMTKDTSYSRELPVLRSFWICTGSPLPTSRASAIEPRTGLGGDDVQRPARVYPAAAPMVSSRVPDKRSKQPSNRCNHHGKLISQQQVAERSANR